MEINFSLTYFGPWFYYTNIALIALLGAYCFISALDAYHNRRPFTAIIFFAIAMGTNADLSVRLSRPQDVNFDVQYEERAGEFANPDRTWSA